ncbi:NAD(P)-binding domain-containing protein [Ancylobacter sp. 6x-1]|uniref:NAD(P)-binding domain-containing protein n=1 Tax=Ancylobacter crimeensis TaxID=2579147 RepID=A0ABT0DG52_9HYPH|nr:NAD(P)-binding domain-containing protein [Ancylobacter crimeensis]MCK0198935.1 NAD(P)-binding domain-containing protein [Ancylobacter crimeensis]
MLRLGFVGTGTLAAAVIDGLQHTHGERTDILVSPRSEAVSRGLAERHANVTRASSNEEVVENADVVFLGVLPSQLEVVAGLPFRADQVVVTFLAGVAHARVVEAVAPASRVARVIPLPPIRLRQGPIAIYPADPVVEELFGGLGTLVVAQREADLGNMGIASAMMSTHYAMQNRMIGWLGSRGMSPAMAEAYVRAMFAGLAAIGLDALAHGESVDPAHHETPGGLNWRGRGYLTEQGWFDAVDGALDAIEAHAHDLSKKKG